MNDEIQLQTSGSRIVTRSGIPVTLRGVAIGGWMNMESFILGYAANETQMRAALRRVLGEEGYARFFDRVLDVFFDDEDAALIASLGLNCLRIPVNYRHFEDDAAPFELKEEGFRILDRAIDRARPARPLLDHRPARGAGLPEPALALRQPDALVVLLGSTPLPGSRDPPLGGLRPPLPRQPLGRGLQPAERARRRRGEDDRPLLRAPPRSGARDRP